MAKRYTKTPTTFDEQVELLIRRGMVIHDRRKAASLLSSINYYRLRPYWFPFQDPLAQKVLDEHPFAPNTTLSRVFRIYRFDRKLRILIVDALERLEVSIKTQFAYHLSHQHGIKAFEDSRLFHSYQKHQGGLNLLIKAWAESKEEF